ncbi:DUF6415 family natural product biosynthesis protein [Streptomyces virginiae]|uniref:DUF6415 family natural product biosynthesis protein n=1 Tax=Streptomyces virginiae TaxID=1961 RepID=UPI00364B64BA
MTPLAQRTPEAVPAEEWVPPLPAEELRRLARHLRTGLAVDDLFDVIEQVIEKGHTLDEAMVLDKAERLRGALMQLVDEVLERDRERPAAPVKALIEQARTLRGEEPPKHLSPLAHLRRLAVITDALLNVLLEGMPEGPE